MLIWAGDADIKYVHHYILSLCTDLLLNDDLHVFSCNWLGGHATVLAMDWYGNETLHDTPFTNMTIDGSAVAAIQNVDNFSFACVLFSSSLRCTVTDKSSFSRLCDHVDSESLGGCSNLDTKWCVSLLFECCAGRSKLMHFFFFLSACSLRSSLKLHS